MREYRAPGQPQGKRVGQLFTVPPSTVEIHGAIQAFIAFDELNIIGSLALIPDSMLIDEVRRRIANPEEE